MRVAVVGCGVVGAAIAYELSQVPGLAIVVLDAQEPAQASTGAALGVLMGAISQKFKGNNLRMRLLGLQRYNEWIPQLEATGRRIPFNQQGILRLCFAEDDLAFWQRLATTRQAQGWPLEILDQADLAARYPQINSDRLIGAVYSPCDRQVDPTALTLALVAAAAQKGVSFHFHSPVNQIEARSHGPIQVHTATGLLEADWLVIAAGLGSTPLTAQLQQAVDIRPVLGQAVRVKVPPSLGGLALQPVITGNDVHLVPLASHGAGSHKSDSQDYWIGATVEFPGELQPGPLSMSSLQPQLSLQPQPFLQPNAEMLEMVMRQAIALCPALADAIVVQSWSGLRPRPEGRPAPIVELLPGYSNIILASGHYRNGVLLAPATAALVKAALDGV